MKILFILYFISTSLFASQLETFLSEANQPVLIADKQKATFSIYYPDKKKLIETEALYGIKKGDVLPNKILDEKQMSGITPSGIFTVKHYFSTKLNKHILGIQEKEGKEQVLSIHSVWLGNPKQNRMNRLLSKDVKDNFITNGCINVSVDFFYNILFYVKDGTKLLILPEDNF